MRTILFVCTGNTCRSPMAEAIARHLVREGRAGVAGDTFFASAGTGAAGGVPPTAEAVAALRALGIEHDGMSKPLTAQMIRNADLVLCMTDAQVAAARDLAAGESPDKIRRLDPGGDIEDPIGLDQAAYDALAARLGVVVQKRLRELLGDADRDGDGPPGR